MQGPAARQGQLVPGSFGGRGLGPLRLPGRVQVGGEQPFRTDADSEGHCKGEQPGPGQQHPLFPALPVEEVELEQEVEADGDQGVLEHLHVRGVDAESDQQGQREEAGELPLLHAAVEAEVHPGQQGDDGHLGVVAGEGEGQEGRREHEGDAPPQAGPAGQVEDAQVAVHPPAGEEDGEHETPAEVALMGGEQLQQAGREVVGADLLGCRVSPEGGFPDAGAIGCELLGERLLAAVEIGACVASVNDLAAEGEVVEIEEGQQREDGRNRPG